jgi:hypothetical protein
MCYQHTEYIILNINNNNISKIYQFLNDLNDLNDFKFKNKQIFLNKFMVSSFLGILEM